MKNKIMPLIISGVLLSFSASSQTNAHSTHPKMEAYFPRQNAVANNMDDSSTAQMTNIITSKTKPTNNFTYKKQPQETIETQPRKQPMYRDTRLGGSSQMYNSYKKNDYGAGAITTNPNK
ncbi:MAG: hypothetical protein ABI472_04815 [Ginsengibacter sp.]